VSASLLLPLRRRADSAKRRRIHHEFPRKRKIRKQITLKKETDLRKKGVCPCAPTAEALCFFSLPYLVLTLLNASDGYVSVTSRPHLRLRQRHRHSVKRRHNSARTRVLFWRPHFPQT